MELKSIRQPSLDELLAQNIDIVICASGFEKRSSSLARKLGKLNCRLISIGFKEFKNEGARPSNDKLYEKLGFEKYEICGNDSSGAELLLQRLLAGVNKNDCRIVIDVSSMTRAWYGGFLRTFRSEVKLNKIIVDFIYVPAVFPNKFYEYPPNEIIAPVQGFSGLSLADKPTALVIGLGHDKDRAIGIKEELDPNLTIIFQANPASDKRYYKRVLEVNADLLETIKPEHIFDYSITDSLMTFNMLESVCTGLMQNFNVVLTSLGPKIFGLYCFLLATKYPEISVWRISAGSYVNVENHRPSTYKIIVESTWSKTP
jgi:hypothetical protein